MLTLWKVHGVPPPRQCGSLHPRPAQSPLLLLSSGSCRDKNPGRVKNRVFEILEVVLVEGKLPCESAIRDAPQTLEHRNGLRQDLLKYHNRPATYLGILGLSPPEAHLTRRPNGAPCVAEKMC
jgi:hypothetical protein